MKHANKVLGVVSAAVLVPLTVYVSGYFLLGEVREHRPGLIFQRGFVARTYPKEWQAELFSPAGQVESRLRGGCPVLIVSD